MSAIDDLIKGAMSKVGKKGSVVIESSSSDSDEARTDAAQKLLDAIKSDDAKEVADAIDMLMEICESKEDMEDAEDE